MSSVRPLPVWGVLDVFDDFLDTCKEREELLARILRRLDRWRRDWGCRSIAYTSPLSSHLQAFRSLGLNFQLHPAKVIVFIEFHQLGLALSKCTGLSSAVPCVFIYFLNYVFRFGQVILVSQQRCLPLLLLLKDLRLVWWRLGPMPRVLALWYVPLSNHLVEDPLTIWTLLRHDLPASMRL